MGFYENLTDTLYQRGMSLNRLLIEMGMSKSNAKSWADGAVPQTATLHRIAKYLDVDPNDLIANKPKPAPIVIDPSSDDMRVQLLRAFDALDLLGRARLLVYAADLVSGKGQ